MVLGMRRIQRMLEMWRIANDLVQFIAKHQGPREIHHKYQASESYHQNGMVCKIVSSKEKFPALLNQIHHINLTGQTPWITCSFWRRCRSNRCIALSGQSSRIIHIARHGIRLALFCKGQWHAHFFTICRDQPIEIPVAAASRLHKNSKAADGSAV